MKSSLIVFLLAFLIGTPTASAILILNPPSVTQFTSGTYSGNYYWVYTFIVPTTDYIQHDVTMVSLADVPGIISLESHTLGWNISGSPGVSDVTLTYSNIEAGFGIGQTIEFAIVDTYGDAATGQYSWSDQNSAGQFQSGTGQIDIPSPGNATRVPEPSSMLLLATGLLTLTAGVKRTKRG
jgi:hypothetical protein